jgi:hypothetical protein
VPVLAREYGLDLQARLSATDSSVDVLLLEALAFAEGRLLCIHPFADLPPLRLVPDGLQETADYLAALQAGDGKTSSLSDLARR